MEARVGRGRGVIRWLVDRSPKPGWQPLYEGRAAGTSAFAGLVI